MEPWFTDAPIQQLQPDGGTLYFRTFDTLYRFGGGDSEPEKILDDSGPFWIREHDILILKGHDGEILSLPKNGGQPIVVASFPYDISTFVTDPEMFVLEGDKGYGMQIDGGWREPPVVTIFEIDVVTNAVRELYVGPLGWRGSPMKVGDSIVFTSRTDEWRPSGEYAEEFLPSTLHAISISTGELTDITPEGELYMAMIGADEDQAFLFGYDRTGEQSGFFSVARTGGPAVPFLNDSSPTRSGMHYHRNGGRRALVNDDQIYLIDEDGAGTTSLTCAPGGNQALYTDGDSIWVSVFFGDTDESKIVRIDL